MISRHTPGRSPFWHPVTFGILCMLFVSGSVSIASEEHLPSEKSSKTSCGNGLLESDESCESCAADCKPRPCEVSEQRETFVVKLSVPLAHQANSVTVRLGYRGDVLGFPGNGAETAKDRINAMDAEAVLVPIDLDYALRVVVARAGGFQERAIFSATFDRCKNAEKVTQAALSCLVEGCAGSGGEIADCSCTVRQAGRDGAI